MGTGMEARKARGTVALDGDEMDGMPNLPLGCSPWAMASKEDGIPRLATKGVRTASGSRICPPPPCHELVWTRA